MKDIKNIKYTLFTTHVTACTDMRGILKTAIKENRGLSTNNYKSHVTMKDAHKTTGSWFQAFFKQTAKKSGANEALQNAFEIIDRRITPEKYMQRSGGCGVF